MFIAANTYYVIDSAKIIRAEEISALNKEIYSFEKDTAMYLTKDKIESMVSLGKGNFSKGGHEGVRRPFTLDGDDGIFALLLVCFIFFTRIYRGGLSFFRENVRLLFSSRRNFNLFSETTTTEFWFNFILIFQTILLTSVVLFDSFLGMQEHPIPQNSFYTISIFTLAIAAFLGIKYLIYRLFGYLFSIQPVINVWLRNYMIVLEMIGIVAFIPALMLVYSQSFHEYLLIFFLLLFIVSQVILFYRLITFFLKEHVNFLFLIAYLCSVEIIPYIILYKILFYLYKVDIISLLWL